MELTKGGRFKIDYESTYFGYELICQICGERITQRMKFALEKKWCPCCGNEEIVLMEVKNETM